MKKTWSVRIFAPCGSAAAFRGQTSTLARTQLLAERKLLLLKALLLAERKPSQRKPSRRKLHRSLLLHAVLLQPNASVSLRPFAKPPKVLQNAAIGPLMTSWDGFGQHSLDTRVPRSLCQAWTYSSTSRQAGANKGQLMWAPVDTRRCSPRVKTAGGLSVEQQHRLALRTPPNITKRPSCGSGLTARRGASCQTATLGSETAWSCSGPRALL